MFQTFVKKLKVAYLLQMMKKFFQMRDNLRKRGELITFDQIRRIGERFRKFHISLDIRPLSVAEVVDTLAFVRVRHLRYGAS